MPEVKGKIPLYFTRKQLLAMAKALREGEAVLRSDDASAARVVLGIYATVVCASEAPADCFINHAPFSRRR